MQVSQDLESLGMAIKNTRISKGITREQLEDLSGVSGDTIKRIEKGKSVTTENMMFIVSSPERDKITIRQKIDALLDEYGK